MLKPTTLTSPQASPAGRPPLAPGLPGLGNALQLAADPLAFFVQAYHRFGPVYRARLLQREIVVLAGQAANQFMARSGDEVLGSHDLFGRFAEEMETELFMVALDGEPHRQLRRLMRPGYSREAFVEQAPAVAALTTAEARSLRPGESRPGTRFFQRLVARQLGLAVTNCDPAPYLDDLTIFLNTVLNTLVMRTWPRVMLRRPAYRRAKRRVFDMARQILAQHRAGRTPGRGPDLIDDLLAARDEAGQPFDEPTLIASTVGPLIAGLDTVAATLSFMLYAVLKHPAVYERVQAEVDQVFAAGAPDPAALRHAPALHGLALETLRMYPVAFAVPRTATAPFEFGGYPVAAGQEVFVASGVTHYLPEFFPEPHRFDIDRYAPPRQEHRQPNVLVPYGLGAHTCLGAGVAEVQIMLTIGLLLRQTRLALDPPGYELSLRVSPLPNPAPSFRFRVLEQRA